MKMKKFEVDYYSDMKVGILLKSGKNYDVKTAFVVVYHSNPDNSYYRLAKTHKIGKVQIKDSLLYY